MLPHAAQPPPARRRALHGVGQSPHPARAARLRVDGRHLTPPARLRVQAGRIRS